ncbi:BZ3500_MvSof-1268-A1-R1_Chr1-1g01238 [Microbotryum saponariae]|uniref:BZ3500_MvSof-1268-A1-R1_Chr1-1g01238 protein n=1 Tax=Microbotryum saponariae TaxID=289078 RepID=A0A2X0MPC7_9BASI|nr:BZ3500_MvSof-1268-A1-R1_Chr1-1g01238 [Microbotryum saponariae]SCZ93755.1 BZ3501_MvSof-1269-A2-R1_Chr1-1g00834 [Microbotryum saponariae]
MSSAGRDEDTRREAVSGLDLTSGLPSGVALQVACLQPGLPDGPRSGGLAQHGGWCGLQQVHLIPSLTTFCSLTLSVIYLDSKPSDHTICCLSCLLPATRQRLPLPPHREDGRSTTPASRPTTSNSSNSTSHRIKEVQNEIRALHDVVRALPLTSRLSSSQKETHVLYNLQRRLEKMQYCLRDGAAPFRPYNPPRCRRFLLASVEMAAAGR